MRLLLFLVLNVTGTLFLSQTYAQDFPTRPIRLVVASAPGGAADFLARASSNKVSAQLGERVVVDNRGGAAGAVASALVAKADPDGHTLLLVFANFATFPTLKKDLSFDVVRDFEPVSYLASGPLVLVVHPSVPAKTVADLVAYAKSRKEALPYATPGVGSMAHLAGELLKLETKIQMNNIAYKGGGPSVVALVGGEVQLYFASPAAVLPQIKAGRIRALAVTSAKRSEILPELPTVAESGYPAYEVNGWFGLFAPAKTTQQIVQLIHKTYSAAIKDADVHQRLTANGLITVAGNPDELKRHLRSEIKKWAAVIKLAKIPVD